MAAAPSNCPANLVADVLAMDISLSDLHGGRAAAATAGGREG
jgi:hypothetical protein